MSKRSAAFMTVRTEGGLLPADLLGRISALGKLDGLSGEAYHLLPHEKLNEAINRSWTRLQGAWEAFEKATVILHPGDPGTTPTRERWLLVLFSELGFGRLQTTKVFEMEGRSYPISHLHGHVPIHLVGCGVSVDRRAKGVAGAAGASPYSLLQEFLNRSDAHLWGFVSNGLVLRILRDNKSLTRQAFVEFDVAAMMKGEEYADFALLWLLCHQSRLEGDRPELFWLEKWSKLAQDQGIRLLDRLRDGVERAITSLGRGFLAHPANTALRERLRSGALDRQDYYRQVLRLIYRLIFLLVAEERDLLLHPGAPEAARTCYERFYSVARLRRLAERRGGTAHGDLFTGLRLVMGKLAETGCQDLALPSLGSFLWADAALPDLVGAELSNRDLLGAIRALSYTEEGKVRRAVDYRNLDSDELGSVYEALLELHPDIDADAGKFELVSSSGSERKQTGSYYTPSSLVNCLLDSALDPVLDEACKKPEPEKAILALKVCDPACGSGHFLIAAAHRMAKRLAAARTGNEEPDPASVRRAIRDVVSHCIYGVDVNPMAVELCKVALWMEAVEPGLPLAFLDAHVRSGNALLGAMPELVARGIPDEAWESLEGDDRKVAGTLKKRNRQEAAGQTTMVSLWSAPDRGEAEQVAHAVAELDEAPDTDAAALAAKELRWVEILASGTYTHQKFVADSWCAAFVWPKPSKEDPVIAAAPTMALWSEIRDGNRPPPVLTVKTVEALSAQFKFFHWHLAFPTVFATGGFDVVIGNPPWERVKLQEQEFFASRHEGIAKAPNSAARKKLIAALPITDPGLWEAWNQTSREAGGESHFARRSGRYPLCGKGDVNTYALFAEHNRSVLGPNGRGGFIVPTGIATDDTTKAYFGDLMFRKNLAAFYGFENEAKLFKGIDHRVNFCLLVVSVPEVREPNFSAFVREPAILRDPDRVYQLTEAHIACLNPNTRTCPVFRTRRDAELNLGLYRRAGVLWRDSGPDGNPWGLRFATMFHMANDSGLFRSRAELEAQGGRLIGNRFEGQDGEYLPLYEAKMVYLFNHRFGDFALLDQGEREHVLPQVPDERLASADFMTNPRYWVAERDVDDRMPELRQRGWLLGWRDVTDARSSVRTVVASFIPRGGVGHTIPLAFTDLETGLVAALYANLGSFALDYAARQKIGGVHLTYSYLKQLPVLAPEVFVTTPPWSIGTPLRDWILSRVLELTFTAWDLKPFARDVGYDGPPFRWDPDRRFLLRCELDAAFFHLYGLSGDDTDYIMDTFPIVRKNEGKAHGEYRTKRVILDIYEDMARANATGQAYQTRLDPPPADPRVAHASMSATMATQPSKAAR